MIALSVVVETKLDPDIAMFDSVFKKSFKPAKCNTVLRLASSRIKLLRNKREIQLKQLKRELAKLLETNQEPSAHIRVELIYREQNIMAAYEIIELFCDLLSARLPVIASQKQCPIDLREAVSSIIYAAPRCSDIPELRELRSLFSAKYGKEFTAIAAELRPDCGVNRVVVEKLSVRGPPIAAKLKLMKDIATEQGLDWDPTALESQNLKSPEDLLDGPSRFFGASQISVQKSIEEPSANEMISPQQSNVVAEAETRVVQNTEFVDEKQFIPFVRPMVEDNSSPLGSQSRTVTMQSQRSSSNYSLHGLSASLSHTYNDSVDSRPPLDRRTSLKGVADAACAAAESAEHAAAAARVAALLAREKFEREGEGTNSDSDCDDGDALSQPQERSEDDHFNLGRVRQDDSSTLRMPIFDEPMEDRGFHRMHFSGKAPLSYDKSREEQSVGDSILCRESDDFDDTETLPQATTSLERHVNDRANQRWLDNSICSSTSQHYQHSSYRTRSFDTAGALPSFDRRECDDPGIKPADQTGKSAPPDRPPPRPPGTRLPTLRKATSFVHPKLPDYDDLAAHFRALKAMRSSK